MTIHQLRIYEIDPTKREAFHARFRDHAVRIMESYDFRILAMWESDTDGRLEFIYLLEWPDVDTLEEQWQRFMADESWSRVKDEARAAIGGEPVLNVTSRLLQIVDSPPNRHQRPPDGYHTLTTRVVVADVAAQVAFLRATFPAEGDVVAGRPVELRIGDSLMMINEAGERDLFPGFLYVYVDDADATYERAIRGRRVVDRGAARYARMATVGRWSATRSAICSRSPTDSTGPNGSTATSHCAMRRPRRKRHTSHSLRRSTRPDPENS